MDMLSSRPASSSSGFLRETKVAFLFPCFKSPSDALYSPGSFLGKERKKFYPWITFAMDNNSASVQLCSSRNGSLGEKTRWYETEIDRTITKVGTSKLDEISNRWFVYHLLQQFLFVFVLQEHGDLQTQRKSRLSRSMITFIKFHNVLSPISRISQ